jgi:gluconolactonase
MNFKYLYSFVLLITSLVFSISSEAKNTGNYCQAEYIPIGSENKVKLVSDGSYFLEGPTWSKQENAFYFSAMDFSASQKHGPKSSIYKLILPNKVSIYKEDAGTNGLLSVGEFIYTMNHATRSLSKIYIASGENETIINNYQKLKFNSPNDLVQSTNGTIYFTDPDWQLSGRTQETPYTGVYVLTNDGTLTLLDKSLKKPNGIVLSPDEKTLYVGSLDHEIVKYQVDKDGSIGEKEAFISINAPDGMAVDCMGNIYIASHREGVIYIYSSEGKVLDKISLGPKVTNVAFGGKYMKTLLITTTHGLYTMNVNVPGLVNLYKKNMIVNNADSVR